MVDDNEDNDDDDADEDKLTFGLQNPAAEAVLDVVAEDEVVFVVGATVEGAVFPVLVSSVETVAALADLAVVEEPLLRVLSHFDHSQINYLINFLYTFKITLTVR